MKNVLTILCSPKPFVDEAAWNQLNAMRSWRAIDPDVEIILYGAPQGAAEAAAEVGAVLVPEIACSPSGAPSFNAMASHAYHTGRHDLQAYVNCDMLLNASLLRAGAAACRRFGRFLLVGERMDLGPGTIVDANQSDWVEQLTALAQAGQLTPHGPTGADYFGFVRGMWEEMPPVFMGRAMCDHALLHHCLSRHIPIIDGTLAVVAVHQFHGYQHVRGGEQEVFWGADQDLMARAHGLRHSLPTVADAGWQFLGHDGIKPGQQRALRRAELSVRYRYGLDRPALALRALQYLGGKRGVMPQRMSATTILDAWRRFMLESAS